MAIATVITKVVVMTPTDDGDRERRLTRSDENECLGGDVEGRMRNKTDGQKVVNTIADRVLEVHPNKSLFRQA